MPILHLSNTLHTGLASSRVMYHGTSTGRNLRILKGILSTGLVDPKKMCQKRERCVGVHVTEDINQATEYMTYAQGDFGGNQVLVVVRADVASPQVLPDSDLAGSAADFAEVVLNNADDPPKLIRKVVPTYKTLLLRDNDNIQFAADTLKVEARKTTEKILRSVLKDLRITSYSKAYYKITYSYVYKVLLSSYARSFADALYDVISDNAQSNNEAVRLLTGIFVVLENELSEIISGSKAPRNLNVYDVQQAIAKTFNIQPPDGPSDIPSEVFRLFLISPRFTSTSDDESSSFTVSYNETIGYSGRTRIIGVIEFPMTKDLDLNPLRSSGACKQFADDGYDDDNDYAFSSKPDLQNYPEISKTLSVPVARVYHGTGSGFVYGAIKDAAKIMSLDSDDYFPISLVAGANRGKPQLAATFSNGYLYGEIEAEDVCAWVGRR